ncbi:PAS domain-containing hybrid sensor histidine kinase/response regulator [Algiphilus aromaticivorans]|uniref:PAS domain-containing hybrid sensor histidine kinase/response regulator n=1 Tax=Algiphilus aromaticivorans TaxID=382454 RepID=UPI0005C24A75|nr:PAS domain-containing hybrid sensor histidine kinase/response regulator [Algiphilus aromaticivorans]
MFTSLQLLSIAGAYVGALFVIAWLADRAARQRPRRERPWTYALALAVYCTAWTFYGAVGRAVDDGWSYLPIYLGPALVFLLGMPLLRRLIAACKKAQLTSVADFIGARFGNDARLAAGATLIALLAGLPYLALQLRGISLGFEVLAVDEGVMGDGLHGVTLITLLLAAFTMLFGTRHIASTESHHGMVLAVAVESVLKLTAFLAVGVAAVWSLGGIAPSIDAARSLPAVDPMQFLTAPFWLQTLLAGAAVIVLPRQFHLMVVENTGPSELRRARWVFPLYLLTFALFVLPMAAAGMAAVGGGGPDRYVLALPQALDMSWLALLAFLGGFSAATGMVIVSCVALATMLSNELILPGMLRGRGYQRAEANLGALLLRVRRLTIVALLLAAWLIDRLMLTQMPLALIGLLSFSAIAHLAPPVLAGIVWPRANRSGAVAGLIGGMVTWLVTTLLPATVPTLAPDTGAQDILIQGTAWSLAVHIVLLIAVSLTSAPSLTEQVHTARLMGLREPETNGTRPGSISVSDLTVLLERFFGTERTRAFIADYGEERGTAWRMRGAADADFIRFCESCLASALGASSARVLIERLRHPGTGEVIDIIEQTSQAVRFNRDLLHATLDHMDQGVAVVDRDLRLTAWNHAYAELFDYPDELLREGTPVEKLVHHNARRGLLGDEIDEDEPVARRMAHLERGTAYRHERRMPDGRVIEITGNPMPGGGFVSTFSDVTAYKRAESMLQRVNEELEQRVAERTSELVAANEALQQENAARAEAEADARHARREAEAANRSKTRFLAATTHDLAQPLNAARLFNHGLENATDEATCAAATNIGRSLAAMEALLEGLSDISRLDSGTQKTDPRPFPVQRLLDDLAAEARAIATDRGLELHTVSCSAWVASDEALLRRIIQNLLANALRYTSRGRVLMGCRRRGPDLLIEVWDTGPGIPADKRREIFEEFRRLQPREPHAERGLGLGLAIAERIARLLDHELTLDSRPGRGSVFRLRMPRATAGKAPVAATSGTAVQDFGGASVLYIDNDPDTLTATAALITRWGCRAICAADTEQALQACPQPPQAVLVDFHLDEGHGTDVMAVLRAHWDANPPAVLVTADHSAEARQAAAAAGMRFLPKPVKPAALRALLSRMLPKRRRSRAAGESAAAQQ